jgi:hypothetical protein
MAAAFACRLWPAPAPVGKIRILNIIIVYNNKGIIYHLTMTHHDGWRLAMTRTSGMFSLLAAALLISAGPVSGDDNMGSSMGRNMMSMQGGQKDECLLVAMNCPDNRVDTARQRVDRLRKEIAKGSEVYSAQELKALNEQLKWIQEDGDNASTTY